MKTWSNAVQAISVALILSACGETERAKAAASLAGKVVAVDTGTYKAEASLEVSRARDALHTAASVCRESEERVADMSATVKNILKDEGVAVSVVELLEAIPQVIGEAKIDVYGECSRLLASYAAARKGGQNHLAATNGMRGIVKVLTK